MGIESLNELTPEQALRTMRKIIEGLDETYSVEEANDVLRRIVKPQAEFSNLPDASDTFFKHLKTYNIPTGLAQVALIALYEERQT